MPQVLLDSVLSATADGRLRWRRERSFEAVSTRLLAVAALEDKGERLWLELEVSGGNPEAGEPERVEFRVRDETGEVLRSVDGGDVADEEDDWVRLEALRDAVIASLRGPRDIDERISEVLSHLPAKAS